ncbi:MAG TPA: hypothetical protein VI386_01520 [Candidatus Sulfotelmatobacter sp.]
MKTQLVNGLAVFDLPPDLPRITSERVKELEYDGDNELDHE